MLLVDPPPTPGPSRIGRPSRAGRREAIRVEALEPRLLLAAGSGLLQVAGIDRSDGAAAPGPPTDPDATVVSDSPTVHSDPSTAQPVPDTGSVVINGAVAPTQAPDMYRVPLDPETGTLTVNLTTPGGSPSAAVRLWVFDASGQELGNFPLSPSADLSVVLRPLDPSAGDAVFVAVSHDGSAAGEPGYYLLVINRDDGPGSAAVTFGPSPIALAAFSPMTPSAGSPGGAFGPAPASMGSAGVIEAPTPTGFGQGSGAIPMPLPIRSAGPSAGLFGDGGEVAPPIDLAADAVDRALFALGSESGVDVARLEAPEAAHIEIARGPLADAGPILRSISLKPKPPESPGDRGDSARDLADRPHDRAGVGIPIGAGLGIVALLGVGLVLPDVASAVESFRRRSARKNWPRTLRGG